MTPPQVTPPEIEQELTPPEVEATPRLQRSGLWYKEILQILTFKTLKSCMRWCECKSDVSPRNGATVATRS